MRIFIRINAVVSDVFLFIFVLWVCTCNSFVFVGKHICFMCFFGYFISQLLHFLDGFKIVELLHIFGVWFFIYTLSRLSHFAYFIGCIVCNSHAFLTCLTHAFLSISQIWEIVVSHTFYSLVSRIFSHINLSHFVSFCILFDAFFDRFLSDKLSRSRTFLFLENVPFGTFLDYGFCNFRFSHLTHSRTFSHVVTRTFSHIWRICAFAYRLTHDVFDMHTFSHTYLSHNSIFVDAFVWYSCVKNSDICRCMAWCFAM